MSRPAVLSPRAQEAVRICYEAGIGTQEQLATEVFGCSRAVVVRALVPRTVVVPAKKEEASND
jgi:hypothetical protein